MKCIKIQNTPIIWRKAVKMTICDECFRDLGLDEGFYCEWCDCDFCEECWKDHDPQNCASCVRNDDWEEPA